MSHLIVDGEIKTFADGIKVLRSFTVTVTVNKANETWVRIYDNSNYISKFLRLSLADPLADQIIDYLDFIGIEITHRSQGKNCLLLLTESDNTLVI